MEQKLTYDEFFKYASSNTNSKNIVKKVLDYDSTFSYVENDVVLYNNDLYIKNDQPLTIGSFVPAEWNLVASETLDLPLPYFSQGMFLYYYDLSTANGNYNFSCLDDKNSKIAYTYAILHFRSLDLQSSVATSFLTTSSSVKDVSVSYQVPDVYKEGAPFLLNTIFGQRAFQLHRGCVLKAQYSKNSVVKTSTSYN